MSSHANTELKAEAYRLCVRRYHIGYRNYADCFFFVYRYHIKPDSSPLLMKLAGASISVAVFVSVDDCLSKDLAASVATFRGLCLGCL